MSVSAPTAVQRGGSTSTSCGSCARCASRMPTERRACWSVIQAGTRGATDCLTSTKIYERIKESPRPPPPCTSRACPPRARNPTCRWRQYPMCESRPSSRRRSLRSLVAVAFPALSLAVARLYAAPSAGAQPAAAQSRLPKTTQNAEVLTDRTCAPPPNRVRRHPPPSAGGERHFGEPRKLRRGPRRRPAGTTPTSPRRQAPPACAIVTPWTAARLRPVPYPRTPDGPRGRAPWRDQQQLVTRHARGSQRARRRRSPNLCPVPNALPSL